MSDTTASLRRKINNAGELGSVVRTMKAMAASSIGQYENAVRSLDDYYRTVQLGLVAGLRQGGSPGVTTRAEQKEAGAIGAVVFGSDQGLVGQFNEVMAEFVVNTLEKLPGKKTAWAVGERIQSHLAATDLLRGERFILPSSISAITPLARIWLNLTNAFLKRNKSFVVSASGFGFGVSGFGRDPETR